MNPWTGILVQLGGNLVAFGIAFGIMKSTVDNITKTQEIMSSDIKGLVNGNINSRIIEERQSVINSNVAEKLEQVRDQLDVHAMAIKQLENNVIQIKAKIGI